MERVLADDHAEHVHVLVANHHAITAAPLARCILSHRFVLFSWFMTGVLDLAVPRGQGVLLEHQRLWL